MGLDKQALEAAFGRWCGKLRLVPGWDVKLSWVEDPGWRESLILSQFEEGSSACSFAYRQFFTALEQTVEELAKCFLLEFGEDKTLSFGRCEGQKSFNELYEGLKNL